MIFSPPSIGNDEISSSEAIRAVNTFIFSPRATEYFTYSRSYFLNSYPIHVYVYLFLLSTAYHSLYRRALVALVTYQIFKKKHFLTSVCNLFSPRSHFDVRSPPTYRVSFALPDKFTGKYH